MEGHKVGRGAIYPLILLGLALFVGPCNRAVSDGAMEAIKVQDKAGGSLPPVKTAMANITPRLPLAITQGVLLILGAYLLWRLWMLPANRRLRHLLASRIYPFSGRARAEGLASLAFHMSRLSTVGLPPSEVAPLAARTVPNLTFRDATLGAVRGMPQNGRLSDALAGSSLVPLDARHMVQNGELTGDVPGALSTVSRIEDMEFEAGQGRSKWGVYFLLFAAAAVAVTIVAVISDYHFIKAFMDYMLKDPTE